MLAGPRLWDIAYTVYRFAPLMPPAGADVADGAEERSPFGEAQMAARLAAFLDCYAQGNAAFRYSQRATLSATSQRLERIAEWTTEHVTRTGNTELANHARMYRAHARWLEARASTVESCQTGRR